MNEAKKWNWIHIDTRNLSKLMMTHFDYKGEAYVGRDDVEDYFDYECKMASLNLGIPYSEFKPIFYDQNSSFKSAFERIFKHFDGLSKDSQHLLSLLNLLLIPVVKPVPKSSVDKLLDDYKTLDENEKLEFLRRLDNQGVVSVEVTFFAK